MIINNQNKIQLIGMLLIMTFASDVFSQSKRTKAELHKQSSIFLLDLDNKHDLKSGIANFLGDQPVNIVERAAFVDKKGVNHTKFQQQYLGVPVLGGELTAHERDNTLTVTGEYYPYIHLNTRPSLSADEAYSKAKSMAQADTYMWQVDPTYTDADPELFILDKKYPAFSGDYTLAYATEVYSTRPLARDRYYIDAHTGEVITVEPLICTESVPATGQTLYLGEVEFIADSVATDLYQLVDNTRGNGNSTYTESNGQRTLVSDDDNIWDFSDIHNRNAAVDAHFCTAQFYDLLDQYFDYSGLDGEGRSMDCVVNVRSDQAFVNAFWDGRFSYFGDGDCNRGPLTSLDVVAHEFTHGLTDFTSDLVYMDQSGALNESMSDIFGKALEWFVTPEEFNWFIGNIFILDDNSRPFRNMADPNLEGHPKFFKGELWFEGEGDNGGVHINSGVLNHWFYLITDGGEVVTEKGDTFNIQGMGMEKAIQIPFLMQRAYLTRTSYYPDAYIAATESAKDIYGEDSEELAIVEMAMNAIGLPAGEVVDTSVDLAITIAGDLSQTCVKDEMIDIDVLVTNNSSEALLLTEPLMITVNNTANIREFVIEEELQPGQEVPLTLEEAVLVFLEGDVAVSVQLLNEDGIVANNEDDTVFENFFEEFGDVELNIVVPSEIDCFERDIPIEAFVRNSSCNPIPAGAEYSIDVILSGEVIETYVFTLQSDLGVGNSVRHTLPYTYPGNVTILDFDMEFEGDINEVNNGVAFLPIFKENSLDSIYVNPMEEQADLTRFITLNENFLFGIVEYEGERYLGTTGQFSNVGSLCTFWQDNFINGTTASMDMCVDMADYENVTFSFDLVQLRNSRIDTLPELNDEVTLARVHWSDDLNSEEFIINNQPDGEIVSYEIPLPDNFTGFISFDFYNHIGSLNFNSTSALENNDYNLLDNLTIRGDFLSSTDDQIIDTESINIYPNPAQSIITIESDLMIDGNYEIFTLEGKLAQSGNINAAKTSINVENLESGIHIVRIVDREDKVYTSRFVIAE